MGHPRGPCRPIAALASVRTTRSPSPLLQVVLDDARRRDPGDVVDSPGDVGPRVVTGDDIVVAAGVENDAVALLVPCPNGLPRPHSLDAETARPVENNAMGDADGAVGGHAVPRKEAAGKSDVRRGRGHFRAMASVVDDPRVGEGEAAAAGDAHTAAVEGADAVRRRPTAHAGKAEDRAGSAE